MKEKETTPAQVTDEQIAAWKEEHGEVHEIMVAVELSKFDPQILQDDDDVERGAHISGFIRTPSDRTMGFASQNMHRPLEAGSIILKNSWLGGDARMLNEKAFLVPAAEQCLVFLEVRQAKLKKR